MFLSQVWVLTQDGVAVRTERLVDDDVLLRRRRRFLDRAKLLLVVSNVLIQHLCESFNMPWAHNDTAVKLTVGRLCKDIHEITYEFFVGEAYEGRVAVGA